MATLPPPEVDDRFLRQVYYLTLFLSAIITITLCVYRKFPIAISFAVGSFISLSMLWSLEFVVRNLVKPGKSTKTKHWIGLIAFGKYAIIGVALYLLFGTGWLNMYALAIGIGMVQGIIVLKGIGLIFSVIRYNLKE